MRKPLEGIRVIEVAAWTFVPVAGAMLADMGAEVIKIEPPTGDPQRGLSNVLNFETRGPNPFNEIPNRGKKSATIDLRTEAGHEILLKLVETADVFLTSYLPEIRMKLKIDVEDIRAANPNIIYARGSGWGANGPMRNTGGFDGAAAWAAAGFANHLDRGEHEDPPLQPAAFFDLQGGNTIAGAIGIALFKRARSGETSIVDVSLMNVGMWAMSYDIVGAPFMGSKERPKPNRRYSGNPITNHYRTSDNRWIYFNCLQGDRYWAEFCETIERIDLIDDERFRENGVRFKNRKDCIAELDKVFAARPLEEWKAMFAKFTGVWSPANTSIEIHNHIQVEANDYLPKVTAHDGLEFSLVSGAMRFDEKVMAPTGPAPELGQDTEALLMAAGIDWETIEAWRARGGFG